MWVDSAFEEVLFIDESGFNAIDVKERLMLGVKVFQVGAYPYVMLPP